MDAAERETLERELRAKCEARDFRAATSLAIDRYGPEIFGFLIKMAGNERDAEDAFSQFSEDVWSGLPDFQWKASFRTWAFVLARHAFYRQRSSPQNDPARNVPISQAPEIARMSDRVRSETVAHLRTENKNEVDRFRDDLDPEDRQLLCLRLDKKLEWEEIALVTLGASDPSVDRKRVSRESARLRKRYQILKDTLAERVRKARLLRSEG